MSLRAFKKKPVTSHYPPIANVQVGCAFVLISTTFATKIFQTCNDLLQMLARDGVAAVVTDFHGNFYWSKKCRIQYQNFASYILNLLAERSVRRALDAENKVWDTKYVLQVHALGN